MVEKIEINNLDLRYEKFRLKSKGIERALLASIIEHDIQEPLKGIDLGDGLKFFLMALSDTGVQKSSRSAWFPTVPLEVMSPLGLLSLSELQSPGPLRSWNRQK